MLSDVMLTQHQLEERRRAPRLACSIQYGSDGKIHNLSESGVYLESKSELRSAETLPIAFQFSSEVIPVSTQGHVMWRRPLKSGGYGYGIHFERTDTESQQQIRAFLAEAFASFTPEEIDTIVIGGGITGIAAALTLKDSVATGSAVRSQIRLLEASDQLGGRLHAGSVGGLPYDAGAQFYAADSRIRDLIRRVGLLSQEIPICPWQGVALDSRKIERFNLKKPWLGWGLQGLGGLSALIRLPLKDIGFLTKVLLGQLKIISHVDAEKWLSLDNGETAGQWVRRTLGEKALNNLIGPFMTGILFADPNKTSKGLLAWFMGTFLKKGLCTLKDGFGNLANAVSEKIPDLVETNARVNSVHIRTDGKVLVKTTSMKSYVARGAILTTPAPVVSKIYSPTSTSEKELLKQVEYAPMVVVTGAMENRHWRRDSAKNDFYAMFIPLTDSSSLIGIGMESAKRGRVVDPDREVVQLYFRPEHSRRLMTKNAAEGEIRNLALGEAERYFPGFSNSVVDAAVDIWPLAIPQFSPGYLKTLVQYKRYVEEQYPPVILAGDYTTLPGVESAYCSGVRAARILGGAL